MTLSPNSFNISSKQILRKEWKGKGCIEQGQPLCKPIIEN